MAVKISAVCDIVDCGVTFEQVLAHGAGWSIPPEWMKLERQDNAKPDRYFGVAASALILICPDHAKLFRQPPESKPPLRECAEIKDGLTGALEGLKNAKIERGA